MNNKKTNKRNNIFFMLLITFIVAFSLVGCKDASEKKKKEITYDKMFIKDLKIALENRWDLCNEDDKNGNTKKVEDLWNQQNYNESLNLNYDMLIKYTNKELEILSKYRNKKFKDNKLQEEIIKYINILEQQKNDVLPKLLIGGDVGIKACDEWSNLYDQRCKLLKEIIEKHNIKFSKKYKKDAQTILGAAVNATNNDKINEAITNMLSNLQYNLEKDYYGYKTYFAIVESNSEYNFKTFYVTINLLDQNGVIIESTNASINNFNSGMKGKLTIQTTNSFASTITTIENYEFQ